MCFSVHHVHAGVPWIQKRASDPLELEVQVLGIEPRSSGNSNKCSLLNADITQQLSQTHTTVVSLPRRNWMARQTISTLSCFCLDTLSQEPEQEKELRQNHSFYIEMACLKETQQSGSWSHLQGPDHMHGRYPGLEEKLMCGKSQGNIREWVPWELSSTTQGSLKDHLCSSERSWGSSHISTVLIPCCGRNTVGAGILQHLRIIPRSLRDN